MPVRAGILTFAAVLSTQLSAYAGPQRQPPDLERSINTLDFGVPKLTGKDSVRHLFEQVNRRERHLLESARWMSLQEAIYTALANNPELAAAYTEIESKTWTLTEIGRAHVRTPVTQ